MELLLYLSVSFVSCFYSYEKQHEITKTTPQKLSAKIIIAENITDCENNICINELVIKIDFKGSELEY